MPPYRPLRPDALSLDGGTWAAAGRPNRTIRIYLDPRILTWLVNQAAARTSLTYIVKEGKPPLTVTLT